MYFIGLDDTDNLESRGTGHLARQIAEALSTDYAVLGVTRHQLLVDPRVPCTKRNSCAAIYLDVSEVDVEGLAERVKSMMLDDYQIGSDPGLCLARDVPETITKFGHRVQRQLVSQQEARELAASQNLILLGLGGDESGVIGALAAVGLASLGDDGRYVQVGGIRALSGLHPVRTLLEAGVSSVRTLGGEFISQGVVLTDKLRPARRGGVPVAYVEWGGEHWLPLKLD